ncbi:uncharacterized protein LOC130424640 isoform X2 [Triplophysa dalaica]|uniref:uncharacterized protein LOC130424640 isoform X2 n=1 Tax=Triplophysa dalaica TaxID=1582913 RepID=UPI0024DF5F0F|nr:uncharacterized protein LOC130424640 isoform X2 [Triplophysa dalaica]
MAMPLFCVVEFIDETFDGQSVVDIIPTCWMTEEQNKCFWPSGRNVTKAVKDRQKQEESWPKYSIRVLGWADTFEAARKKSKKAEATSDLQTDGDDLPARRKRRAPKPLLASSEEETDIEGDVLPPPPEAFVSKKMWGAGEARTKNRRRSRSPRVSQRGLSSPHVSHRGSRSPRVSQRRSRSPRVSQRRSRSPRVSQRRSRSPHVFHRGSRSPCVSQRGLSSPHVSGWRSRSQGSRSHNVSGSVSEFTTPYVSMHYELVDLPFQYLYSFFCFRLEVLKCSLKSKFLLPDCIGNQGQPSKTESDPAKPLWVPHKWPQHEPTWRQLHPVSWPQSSPVTAWPKFSSPKN